MGFFPSLSLSSNVVIGDPDKPMNTESMKNLGFILLCAVFVLLTVRTNFNHSTASHLRDCMKLMLASSSTNCRNRKSTKDYVRIYQQNMQNKPNSPNVQMNASLFITMNYTIFASLTKVKNKPNSNPIQTQLQTNHKKIRKIQKCKTIVGENLCGLLLDVVYILHLTIICNIFHHRLLTATP